MHILSSAHCFLSIDDSSVFNVVAGATEPTRPEKYIKVRKGEIFEIKSISKKVNL